MTTLNRLIPILRRTTGLSGEETLTADTGLVGSGLMLDSVAVLELIVATENEFDIELTEAKLIETSALKTLGSLAELVDAVKRGEN